VTPSVPRSAAFALAFLVGCAASQAPAGPTPPKDDPTNDPPRGAAWSYGQPGLEARRATAQAEVGEAIRVIETSGDACTDACPALASLKAGVAHLCNIADNKDDEVACHEARARLTSAVPHVRAACGTCGPPGTTSDDGGYSDYDGPPL
jgi:hypothetical protein